MELKKIIIFKIKDIKHLKKICKFCSEGVVWIDYKNIDRVEQFVIDKEKMILKI